MDHPRQILKLRGLTEVLDLGIANLAAATLGAQPHDIKESHLRHKPQPPQISTCSAWEVKNWRVSSWRVDNGLGLQIFQDDRRWVIVQPKTSGANLQQVCKLKCLPKTSKNYPWSNFIYWIYLRCQWVYLKMFSNPTLHATGKWRLKNHGCYSRLMVHHWKMNGCNLKTDITQLEKRENHPPWKISSNWRKPSQITQLENIIFHPPPFLGFQPWIPHRRQCRLPCHLWCWHGANLTWKTAAGQRDISKFLPWKWEYSTYISPLNAAIFHKNDPMWVK